MLLLFFAAGNSVADVLPDHDNGPLTGIFGFPESAEGGDVVGRGRSDWSASFIIASHNIDETRGAENLRFDGESSRLAFNYRYGITDRLDLGIEVPYLWHRAGFLDAAIDGWHDFFGLPEGARAGRARDRLDFFYADANGTAIDLARDSSGIGDIRVLLGWQISAREHRRTALRPSEHRNTRLR